MYTFRLFIVFTLYTVFADTSCSTDIDCQRLFNESICIAADVFGESVQKCVANTAELPACRGTSMGLCPAYQSPNEGLLNTECIFQEYEQEPGENVTLCALGDSDPDCHISVTLESEDSSSNATSTVVGRFRCVDINECVDLSVYPDECGLKESKTCNTGKDSLCNNHGTCTHISSDLEKRGCQCYPGFSGRKCEKTLDGSCIFNIDCGGFGECVEGVCECDSNWNKDQRCNRCSDDDACEFGSCVKGKCDCLPGYMGMACDALEHNCIGVECGSKGSCVDGECVCNLCFGSDCTTCSDSSCSNCPTSHALAKAFIPLRLLIGLFVAYSLRLLI